ncbi:MAG: P-loop NTPase [Myxococcales bacterium]|nr:P-loop NTPase [Myxococcales bacterium]MCB9650017.1 P-loop NTPase [Deltaproteobacteria bacterium]
MTGLPRRACLRGLVYTLLVMAGPDFGRRHVIDGTEVSVGSRPGVDLVLTDPGVLPKHFTVVFEEGSWKAITSSPQASMIIDRRWRHPRTGRAGARIFVGDTQLLLYSGDVDLEMARLGSEGLDFDADTLRDDAVNQVRDRAMRFRSDMEGKAQPVSDQRGGGRRSGRGTGVPPETMSSEGSRVFSGKAGMMRLPETVEQGRRTPPQGAQAPKSARASWNPPGGAGTAAPTPTPQNRALVKGQMISLTDTAISAMPSQSRDLAVLHEKDGRFASELRILATRMEDLRARLGYKSFLVTSASDGDGKTVVAANLALVMSEDSERKVALVDANFRGPRAADLFNLDKSRGLLAALEGKYPLSQCVARVLGRNLVVLHAGGEHNNPASVLSSPKFKALLSELNQAVDFMVVDAPSAIPYADVPLLTQHVDAVLMVASAHRTNRSRLDKALDTLGRGRVVGSVFLNRKKGAPKREKT